MKHKHNIFKIMSFREKVVLNMLTKLTRQKAMLTLADEGGRGVGEILTLAVKEGEGRFVWLTKFVNCS